jgi:rare lipoprotein A
MSIFDPVSLRTRFPRYAFLALLLALSGCTLLKWEQKEPVQPSDVPQAIEIIPPEPPRPETPLPDKRRKPDRTGKPYYVKGKVYRPLLTALGYQEKGIASWYGPSFHGRQTSCGEVFDMHKPTAAHRLLPMHTKISVTNLENGKSVILTVNDRGPFVSGRVLDLSYAAAKKLAMTGKGLARIQIRTQGPVEGQREGDLSGEFCVHVGSFESREDAFELLRDMKSLGYKSSILKVVRADRGGEVLWRVEVGPYRSMSDADKAEVRVAKDYPSAFVVARN